MAKHTTASAAWLMVQRIIANIIRLVALAILARQLSPVDFGVVALAQVLLQLITLVGEGGIGTYVIYDAEEGREERVQAAFWLNLASTVLQGVICIMALPVVGAVFNQPQLTPVLAALVGVFFIHQLAIVPEALLRRELRHPILAKRDIVLNLVSAAASVGLALTGAGVWSLVLPSLALEPVRTLFAAVTAGWWPRLPLHVGQWRRIVRYTAPLMGSNVLIPVTNDGDTLLVGKLLGAATVGYYNMAWQLSNLIGRNVTAVVTVVAMPALALLRDDADRFRAAYLRIIRFLGFTCLPLLCGMAIVAGDLVPVVYGPGWTSAIALLRVFIVFTLVRTLTSPSSILYNLKGRSDINFKVTAWLLPAYLAAVLVGSQWGAIGVASGVVLVRTISALAELRLALGHIDLMMRAVGRALTGPVALTLVMSCSVWVARFAMGHLGVELVPRLMAAIAIGGTVYLASLAFVQPAGYEDLTRSLRSALGRGRGIRAGSTPVAVGEQP